MKHLQEVAICKIANAHRTEEVPSWKLLGMITKIVQAKTIDERIHAIDYLMNNIKKEGSV